MSMEFQLVLPHCSSLLYTIPSIFEPCELSPNTELHWRNSFCLSATLEYWIDGKGANRENTGAIESHCYYTEARYCTFFFVSFFSLSSFIPTSFTICQVVASKLKWICLPYSDESRTFECLYLHPHKQCASLFLQLGWISPSTGDWKRSVTSVRSHSEFRTGCDSFLRQRDALVPQRFNRSHISVTGYRVLAGVCERLVPSEPDVIDTPVNHTLTGFWLRR